jgi:hypothetical protein
MREVLGAFRELGVEHFDLDVQASNHVARSLYARWGLKDEVIVLTGRSPRSRSGSGSQEAGVVRLDPPPVGRPEAVEQAVRQFVPRLPGWLAGSLIASAPRAAGSPSTTTSATGNRRCCADSPASFPTGWGRDLAARRRA